ncbi:MULTISPECIES: fumarate hydratase [Clostridia]|uniref:fumarate hydratase n=1 Tax=Clostridia TaxID=186801 RepID=UPI00067F5ECD|nr:MULTISPECIES: fumarate hydratase [Clostridia]
MNYQELVNITKHTLIRAASSFTTDKTEAYKQAIAGESNSQAKWIMESMLENAVVAAERVGPLCDDTGIPHVMLEVGKNRTVTGELLEAIREGVAEGLRQLPGRPMAIMGDERQRLDQSGGLDIDSGALEIAPVLIRPAKDDVLRLHILMQGGGPEIRSKTYRVFHKHDVSVIEQEIIEWAKESVKMLGCTPTTLAVGIGRSHYEATSLMIEAMAKGDYAKQSTMEMRITEGVNESNVGPLGLGGTTVLSTFLRVGPQRASGVRIVCMRPCCCCEPRRAYSDL